MESHSENKRLLSVFFLLAVTALLISYGCGGGGESNDTTAPGTPSGLTAVAVSSSQINLSWNASTDNIGVAEYRIYRDGTYLKSVTSLSASDTGVNPNTGYTYSVSALDAAGNESPQSTGASATTFVAWTGIKLLGSTSDDWVLGVATDSVGNVYITGYTSGNLDGETNAGGRDAFVAKYDSSGVKKWTRLLGTLLDDSGSGIAVDSSDNIYLTGYTYGNLDGQINAGANDAFIAKYDSAGNKIWVRLMGTAGADDSAGIAIDNGGNIYIAGTASGAYVAKCDSDGNLQWSVPLEPVSTYVRATGIATDSNGNIYITGVTGFHFFLAKYSPSGTQLWIESMGDTEGEDHSYGVAVDSSGNTYVTGFTSSFIFDGHQNNGQSHMGAGTPDVFLVKFDPSGNKLWSRLLGTYQYDYGMGIAINQSGNVFIAGRTEGNLAGNINNGGTDIFLAAYNSSGDNLWTHLLGTAVEDAGSGVAVDKYNNIFITGYTQGALSGNVNMGGADIFIAKYNSLGTLQ